MKNNLKFRNIIFYNIINNNKKMIFNEKKLNIMIFMNYYNKPFIEIINIFIILFNINYINNINKFCF